MIARARGTSRDATEQCKQLRLLAIVPSVGVQKYTASYGSLMKIIFNLMY